MKRVEVHPDAQAELRDGVRWYSERSVQVARRFVLAVKSSISAIREHPDRYAKWANDYRHYLVPGFPYYVAYRCTDDVVFIAAIRHSSRDQDAWRGR
jgi:plasmid stabilization system protein ParE